ncbi:MAG: SEC-C domain-containing protein [Lachnospiraceae bacterium]|nr:SEC-C domain-containing protein [Lachnospiraceae bacterium]
MAGYRVKITLKDTKPPVWRRVILPEKITFGELHQVIQILFGWEDYHLHVFTFSDDEVEIVADFEDALDDAYLENQVLIDDFINDNRYIEYTYDFGDDWQHRIVLEAVEKDYDKRYVTLLKYKGDNFEEDSGGIWGNMEYDDPSDAMTFDMAAVQKKLDNTEFLVHERVEYDNNFDEDMMEYDSGYDDDMVEGDFSDYNDSELDDLLKMLPSDMRDELSDIMDNYNETGDMKEALRLMENSAFGKMLHNAFDDYLKKLSKKIHSNKSKMDKECSKWYEFCKTIHDEEPAQQLSFNFVGINADGVDMGTAPIVCETGSNTIVDNLCKNGSVKLLRDYCKYLRLDHGKNDSKNKLAHIIEEAFINHPEYVVTGFVRKEWEQFYELITNGTIPDDMTDYCGMHIALSLGLVEISYKSDIGVKCADVRMAANLANIMNQITPDITSKLFDSSEKFTEDIGKYVIMYGCISFRDLYDVYCKEINVEIDKESFCRNIFWYLRMRQRAITSYYRDDSDVFASSYVGVWEADIINVCDYAENYVKDWKCKRYTNKQCEDMVSGFNVYYEEWNYMTHVLSQLSTSENVYDFVEDMFCGVRDGWGVYDVLGNIYECFEVHTAIYHAQVWLATMKTVINTDIPMLKSYSRQDYFSRMKEWPPMLYPLEDEEILEETCEPERMGRIVKLPDDVQMAIYNIMCAKKEPIKEIKRIDGICGDNPEWLYLLAVKYTGWEQLEKARETFNKLESVCKDSNIKNVIDDFYDYYDSVTGRIMDELFDDKTILYPKGETYVRSEKKVGRNDPCPCGSGKKYKHCCGRG